MEHSKILDFGECAGVFATLREAGERLVHCHGTFDLLHPGHIKHLEEASRHGTKLVVSVTSAPFVNKGPGRPVFSDQQRAYQLAHLGIVDYVVIVPASGAVEILERVQPQVYCKGIEYATPKDDTEARIHEDAEAVERFGGEVKFVGETLHSSTRLIADHVDALEPEVREYIGSFPAGQALQNLDSTLEAIRKLRVLVVGDLIVDRYTYCYLQGLTSKAKVPSVRPTRAEDQLGGAFAIARQVATFGCSTRLITLAGQEPWLDVRLAELSSNTLELDLVRDPAYRTIVKQRYVERLGVRKDLVKYFAVEDLLDEPPAGMQEALLARLKTALTEVDLVILCDYGHGLVSPEVQALLVEQSPYLALNVQTNSNNYGFNLITKYPRADLFSLDERELALACGERKSSFSDRLEQLARALKSQLAWLTLGSSGSIVRGATPDDAHSCPAMTKRTVDTVGAGDAFFATAALCGRVGADLELSSVLANLSGAIATGWAGNQHVVESATVIKNARYLLKSAAKE